MKKIFAYMALASLALTACHTKEWYENDGIPIEPEPEPVITYEGSGHLVRDDVNGNISETNHTYSWKAEETTIKLSRRPTTRTKGKNTQQFPAADLAEFRKRLILLRQEALGQSATLRTNALEQTDDRSGEDEDGSDAFMRLQNLSQVDSQNKVIQQIDEALARIQEGTYGICEICGQLIRKPRLLNLPFVHTCMECQSVMEENPMGMR